MEKLDQNTKFFHNLTLYNRSKNKIVSIKNHLGTQVEKPSNIVDTFVTHFKNILNKYEGSNKVAQDKMLKCIPKLISTEDNKFLNKPITLKEVKSVVFKMNLDKSPSPYGF